MFQFESYSQILIPAPAEKIVSEPIKPKNLQWIFAANKDVQPSIKVFNQYLKKMSIPTLLIKDNKENCVKIIRDKNYKNEEYKLELLPNNCVQITGNSNGIFYGLMSLVQMIQYSND